VTYYTDVNILQINDYICEKLQDNRLNIPELEEELNCILDELEETVHNRVTLASMLQRAEELGDEIEALKNNSKYYEYINETKSLVSQYKKIGPIRKKMGLGTKAVEEINPFESQDLTTNTHD